MTGNKQGFQIAHPSSMIIISSSTFAVSSFTWEENSRTRFVASSNARKDVNRIVSFIRVNPLHHWQFRRNCVHSSASSAEEQHLYKSAVRWLSQGETSRRVLLLRKEIVEHYSLKNKDFLAVSSGSGGFSDPCQVCEGKKQQVFLRKKYVQDFRKKCRLLRSHLQQRKFFYFMQLTAPIESKEVHVDEIPIALFWRFRWAVAGIRQPFPRLWDNLRNNDTRCFTISGGDRELNHSTFKWNQWSWRIISSLWRSLKRRRKSSGHVETSNWMSKAIKIGQKCSRSFRKHFRVRSSV